MRAGPGAAGTHPGHQPGGRRGHHAHAVLHPGQPGAVPSAGIPGRVSQRQPAGAAADH